MGACMTAQPNVHVLSWHVQHAVCVLFHSLGADRGEGVRLLPLALLLGVAALQVLLRGAHTWHK